MRRRRNVEAENEEILSENQYLRGQMEQMLYFHRINRQQIADARAVVRELDRLLRQAIGGKAQIRMTEFRRRWDRLCAKQWENLSGEEWFRDYTRGKT